MVGEGSLPIREVNFELKPIKPNTASLTVTKILPTESMSPRLKELFAFTTANKIVVTKGHHPQLTNHIGVSDEALKSELALTEHLERSLIGIFDAPLNANKLPAQSRLMVEQMKAKHKTKFINEKNIHGISYSYQNQIGIKTRHIDNLRVNGAVTHEITHNTTDRKVQEAFNPKLMVHAPGTTRLTHGLTTALAGREMRFKSKFGKKLSMPHPIGDDYEKFYRADEVEAHIRELAQSKKDQLDLGTTLGEVNAFMDAQEKQLKSLLKNQGDDLKIVTEKAENELLAGRKQRRLITSTDVDFNLFILVPKDLSRSEEVKFIRDTLTNRLKTLESYRLTIQKRFK